MNTLSKLSRRQWLAQTLVAAGLPLVGADLFAAPALPSGSVYQLDFPLVDQHGQSLRWRDLRGKPVLTSMFYTSCEMVCPLIFEALRRHLDAAGAAVKAQTRVVLVSFDPERDTVEKLKASAEAHHADAQWTLARASADDVRKLAAVLGVQYRKLANGEYNHSSTMFLLDREGRIAARSAQLAQVDQKLVHALTQVASAS
jgi:protein SCO1/2